MGSSVEMGFRVLAEVALGARDVAAVADALDLEPADVEPTVASLLKGGSLVRNGDGLAVSASLSSISRDLFAQHARVSVAGPILAQVADELGVEAALAIADGDAVRQVISASPSFAAAVVVGDAVPLHLSVPGLVLLSLRDEAGVESYLAGITVAVSREQIREQVQLARRVGWLAGADGRSGTSSAATAVGGEGLAPAALIVMGPAGRVPPVGGESGFGEALLAAARRIGERPPTR